VEIVSHKVTIPKSTTPPPRLLRGAAAVPYYVAFFRDPIACMCDAYHKNGDITILGPVLPHEQIRRLNILSVGPEYNRQVLGDPELFRTTGQTLRGPDDSAQRRLRFGLTRMQGAKHKQQRKLVMPPFHKKAVESYHELMVQTADTVLSEWRVGTVRNLYRDMRSVALRLASTVLFSPDPRESFRIGSMVEEWLRRNFSAPVWLFPLDLPGTPYRSLLKHADKLEEMILSMIDQRRKNPEGRTDVLSILTQARDDENHGMTDMELVGQAAILFGASYETTASTLTWTLFLLAQHPKVSRELMDELDGVLHGAPPRNDQLPQLPLLDRVTKESMRILPPVPYTIRSATAPVEMGGYQVPKGSRVICSHFLTHHLADLYPDPEKFLPDRWLTIDPSQYEYMPFSAGPRACIGAIFAMQAMKISVSMILQRFRLEVIPGAKVERVVRVTMSPRHDIPIKIFEQDRKFTRSDVRGNINEMVEMRSPA
jgi:cytochrome P450